VVDSENDELLIQLLSELLSTYKYVDFLLERTYKTHSELVILLDLI